MTIINILVKSNLVESKAEARRLIQQKAVKFQEDKGEFKTFKERKRYWKIIEEFDWLPVFSGVLKVGKKRFLHLVTPFKAEEITEEEYKKELEVKNV